MSAVEQPFDLGLVGARIDKYEVVEEVGYGGMSVVYRATDEVLGRVVALKVLHAHLSKREESRRRFRREAQAVAKLRHPNIVEIYDFSGEDSAHAYIVTEFIEGPTLRAAIDKRRLGLPEIGVMIALEIAEAMKHAHDLGVTHRDIKPENAMVRDDGVVKLMDFGIAQVRESERVTETGSLLGSPAHMAPEVVSGEEPDARSDIFSLGTVLYYVCTGELPFSGRNAAVVLRRIVEGTYTDPEIQAPRIGQRLGGIIRKCLATDPEERYQTVDEVLVDLRACLDEVGLIDVRAELRQYFDAPDTYERALKITLLDLLERRGREALQKREVARAVDFFNRVLAIDDGHEGVRRLLKRLDRRRRVAAWGLTGSAVLALGAVVLLATGAFGSGSEGAANSFAVPGEHESEAVDEATVAAVDDGDEVRVLSPQVPVTTLIELTRERFDESFLVTALQTSTAAIDDALSASREAAQSEHGRLRSRAELARERDEGRAEAQPAGIGDVADNGSGSGVVSAMLENRVPEPTPVLVTLRPNQRQVNVAIDGEDVGDLGMYPGGIPLAPGRHVVRYEHPSIVTDEQIVDVPSGRANFPARRFILTWKPAQLIVHSDVEGRVFIDGHHRGFTGEPIAVGIDSQSPEHSVEVMVVAAGLTRHFGPITLRPDQEYPITAQFRGE